MPKRAFFSVERSPQEIVDLWTWAQEQCRGRLEHEAPYAMGILITLQYLMSPGACSEMDAVARSYELKPQDYRGVLKWDNIKDQAERDRMDAMYGQDCGRCGKYYFGNLAVAEYDGSARTEDKDRGRIKLPFNSGRTYRCPDEENPGRWG